MNVPVDVTTVAIDTARLALRPVEPSDADDMFAYASVPGVGEMAGWKHHESIEETKAILRLMTEHKDVLAIVRKADGRMIGTLGLHPTDEETVKRYPEYRMREIGYVLAKDCWGQGLMSEAVNALIAYCFGTLHLDALTCCHFAENDQSRRVIEKCGFRFFARGKAVSERLNRTFDDMRYILLRKDCGPSDKEPENDGTD